VNDRLVRPARGAALIAVCAVAMLVLAACGAGPRPTPSLAPTQAGAAVPAGAPTPRLQFPAPPPMSIDTNKTYTATIKTSMGDITVQLNAKDAPKTVNNFVFLAKQGFYNGTTFHRVIKGFVIQGGDPTGTGTGGPGYQFADEPVKGTYDVGAVAMANSGPNTNGSQFFICEGDQCKTLPPKYNLFGKVTEGIDVVHKIGSVPTDANDRPTQTVTITSIEIAEQ
jgi:cyclophilin family peptidyl-prolyl cis-trans isomerase